MNDDQMKRATISMFDLEQSQQKLRPATIARVKLMLEQYPDLKAKLENYRSTEPQLSEYQAIMNLWVQGKL
jgi:hypothetical protein